MDYRPDFYLGESDDEPSGSVTSDSDRNDRKAAARDRERLQRERQSKFAHVDRMLFSTEDWDDGVCGSAPDEADRPIVPLKPWKGAEHIRSKPIEHRTK